MSSVKKFPIPFSPDFVHPVFPIAGEKTFSTGVVNISIVTVDRPIEDNGVEAIPNKGLLMPNRSQGREQLSRCRDASNEAMSGESLPGRLIQQELTLASRCVSSTTSVNDVANDRLLQRDHPTCVPHLFRQVHRRLAKRHQDGGNYFFHSIYTWGG
jgi:hypothetical protein